MKTTFAQKIFWISVMLLAFSLLFLTLFALGQWSRTTVILVLVGTIVFPLAVIGILIVFWEKEVKLALNPSKSAHFSGRGGNSSFIQAPYKVESGELTFLGNKKEERNVRTSN